MRAYSVAGELFPTNRLGVRVGYSESHRDIGLDSDGYDVTATWFIKPRIGDPVQSFLACASGTGG